MTDKRVGDMLELREIRCLIALEEYLHFGRAAERLNVSQSRVSQLVRGVEERIGAPLFERSGGRVRTSSLGESLIGRLRPLYQELTEAYENAVAFAQGLAGTLRVGFAPGECTGDVDRRLRDFRAAHPECEVSCDELPYGSLIRHLRRHRVDVALVRLPVREPDLAVGPVIAREGRSLVAAAGHELARRPQVAADELAHERLITLSGAFPSYWREFHYPRATRHGTALRYHRSVRSYEAMLGRLLDGREIALVPDSVARRWQASGAAVTAVPVTDLPPAPTAPVWCAAEENARIRSFAAAFSVRT